MSEYIRIKKRMRIWYERIFMAENIRIYLNIRIFNTLWYEKYDTNEYPNIFGSKKWYERIYEYIRIKKRIRIWYERIFVAENIRIYSNIRIFVTLCIVITAIRVWWIFGYSYRIVSFFDTDIFEKKSRLCAQKLKSEPAQMAHMKIRARWKIKSWNKDPALWNWIGNLILKLVCVDNFLIWALLQLLFCIWKKWSVLMGKWLKNMQNW